MAPLSLHVKSIFWYVQGRKYAERERRKAERIEGIEHSVNSNVRRPVEGCRLLVGEDRAEQNGATDNQLPTTHTADWTASFPFVAAKGA